jgi:hypothetical protein
VGHARLPPKALSITGFERRLQTGLHYRPGVDPWLRQRKIGTVAVGGWELSSSEVKREACVEPAKRARALLESNS